ncbi:MAG: hypothetical protein K2X93_17890 [Candidatus Obscuribacterales bacterium]|nr:hypothetical protein [Candidatus Obscuribacterales bacterium]
MQARYRDFPKVVTALCCLFATIQLPGFSHNTSDTTGHILVEGASPTASAMTRCIQEQGTARASTKTSCCAGNADETKADLIGEYNSGMLDLPEEGCDPVRFHQARYLIESCRDYIKVAKPLHEKMEQQILIAKTLKGKADMLINNIPAVAPPKLKGLALQSATQDYTKDLQSFVNHADQYKMNLQIFRNTIGECRAAQAAYDRQRNQYDLHCNQFHVTGLSDIEPPHICGALGLTEGEAGHISGMLRADEQRLSQTMQELRQTNALVQESRNMVAANINASAHDAMRQKEEQKLSKEFGRLREEYELLKIQSNMLGTAKQREVGRLIQRSVSGNVVSR